MFGFIMAVVACNIWCLDAEDVASSQGDSVLDLEIGSPAERS